MLCTIVGDRHAIARGDGISLCRVEGARYERYPPLADVKFSEKNK